LARVPRTYKKPVLSVSTDGVGTKVLLAKELRKFDTIGIDLVAMCVNDILTIGAEPFLFLDYLATGYVRVSQGQEIVRGIAKGCQRAGCALVGGETAEMPSLYRKEDFDLAGFCVGLVEKDKIIDGRKVKPGDQVIGLPSNGVHSNGYSLVREILRRRKISLGYRSKILGPAPLGKELLKPTKIYVKEILTMLKKTRPRAMAHITGGGLEGNLPRVLPKGTAVEIDPKSWKVPSIFRFLKEKGRVSQPEMFRTFNMGIGFVIIAPRGDASLILKSLSGARKIGNVIRYRGKPKLIWL